MHKRALDFVMSLNSRGWTINEQMADQFVLFANAECARTAQKVLERVKIVVKEINWKD